MVVDESFGVMFEGPSITEHAMDIVEDADQQAICTDQQSIYSIREAMDTNDDIFDTIKNPQSTTEASLDILPTSSVLPTWDTILAGEILVTIEGRQGDRKMTFARPPSKSGEPKHEWTVKLPFHGWSMAIHPPTNVVAVSENTGSVSGVPIHILTMDTGEPHPFAEISKLPDSFRGMFSNVHRPYISISESIVAILFNESNLEQGANADGLLVWNWRTGSEVFSMMNTYYDTITLISNTLLVAGYAFHSLDMEPEFALDLIDTSTEPVRKTRLELYVPPSYRSDGHFFGLHSGESALYNSKPDPQHPFSPFTPEVIITAWVQNHDAETDGFTVYCVASRVCEFLELAKRGGNIPWEGWKGLTITPGAALTHTYTYFSVLGLRLEGPLEEINLDEFVTLIHEFDPRCAPLVSSSDEELIAATDSFSLMDAEVEEREMDPGGEAEEGGMGWLPLLGPVSVGLAFSLEDKT